MLVTFSVTLLSSKYWKWTFEVLHCCMFVFCFLESEWKDQKVTISYHHTSQLIFKMRNNDNLLCVLCIFCPCIVLRAAVSPPLVAKREHKWYYSGTMTKTLCQARDAWSGMLVKTQLDFAIKVSCHWWRWGWHKAMSWMGSGRSRRGKTCTCKGALAQH